MFYLPQKKIKAVLSRYFITEKIKYIIFYIRKDKISKSNSKNKLTRESNWMEFKRYNN